MPTSYRTDVNKVKHYTFYYVSTFFVIAYLLLASVLNIIGNIPLAAVINCTAAVIILGNLFLSRKINDTKKSFLTMLIIVIIDLFLHQALNKHTTLNNYVWLPIIPLLLGRYISPKQNTVFTIFILFMIGAARVVSMYLPESWYYVISAEYIFRGDLIAVSMFVLFNLFVGIHLNDLEQKAHKSLDDKIKENAHLISILTHDISNQVTVINLACNKLNKQFKETVFCTSLDKIKKRTDNIERLINGVRISQQAMDSAFELSRVSLIDLLETITIDFENSYPDTKVKLNFDYDQSFDYHVAADKKLLLKNAIAPIVNSAVNLYSNIDMDESINIMLKISHKKIKLIITSRALNIFNSPMLSNINAVSLPEKEAVLAVVVAKKIVEKFGGNVEVSPARNHEEDSAIIFSFPKKGSII